MTADESDQPSDKLIPDKLVWLFISHMPDGKTFVADRHFLIETSYLIHSAAPQYDISAEHVMRILQWPTTHEFQFHDLHPMDIYGHLWAPQGILLNRLYIDYLRDIPTYDPLRFRASGREDPVLVFDGERPIGAVMPIKTELPSPPDNLVG